jgi:hypothetical protein
MSREGRNYLDTFLEELDKTMSITQMTDIPNKSQSQSAHFPIL